MLTSRRVHEVFLDCLFRDDEVTPGKIPDNAVIADGIRTKVAFHNARLASYQDEITKMLLELPEEFTPAGGGGSTFLNACNDRHGRLWGQHINIDQLVMLGLALGMVRWNLPREMWRNMPGGMPYFTVLVQPLQNSAPPDEKL